MEKKKEKQMYSEFTKETRQAYIAVIINWAYLVVRFEVSKLR